MSILKAVVQWTARWQAEYKIPKGFILLRYEGRYRRNVATALMKLDEFQEKRKTDELETELRPIDMTLDIHYKKRSLDANALMWSIYGIEANELNGGRKSADMITPEKIYRDDMRTFAPRLDVTIPPEGVDILRRTYSMIDILGSDDATGRTNVRIYLTTSHLDSKEMHYHLQMQFDRLSEAGVTIDKTSDISDYWLKWRAAMNEQKIVLHDDLYTVAEYKELVKNCEACGRAVWHDSIGSSVAYIKAVGMGGHRENKYHGSEIMHLCDIPCHQKFDNGKGRDKFLAEWPHLTYKVSTALNRDYGPAPEQLEIF